MTYYAVWVYKSVGLLHNIPWRVSVISAVRQQSINQSFIHSISQSINQISFNRNNQLTTPQLLGLAPAYPVEFCGPTQSVRSSRSLRSADQGLLRVPFARNSTRQKRAFAVAGPSIWNDLPLSIRSLPRTLSQTFLSQLKAVLFGRVGVGRASE